MPSVNGMYDLWWKVVVALLNVVDWKSGFADQNVECFWEQESETVRVVCSLRTMPAVKEYSH